MKRKKLWIAVGAVTVVVLILSLNIYRNSQGIAVPVQTFTVKQERIEENVLADGKVEIPEKHILTARTNAIAQQVLVEEGVAVRAGTLLVKLDTDELVRNLQREEANLALQQATIAKAKASARPQEIAQDQAAVKQAKAAYQNAKLKYDRSQTLYDAGAVSKEGLEQAYQDNISAEAAYATAQQRLSLRQAGDTRENILALEAQVKQVSVAVNQAKELLAQAEVKAPIDGVILSLSVEKGKYVTVGTPLLVLGNPKNLQVKAEINEADSGHLQAGQAVKITCDALIGENFAGKILRVGKVARTKVQDSEEQADVQVVVSIDANQVGLKPGYSVDIKITTASKAQGLVVPYEAVLEQGKAKAVFVVDQGKVHKRPVQTGIGNELYVTIETGVKKGEKVVANPSEKLKEGTVVKEIPYQTVNSEANSER